MNLRLSPEREASTDGKCSQPQIVNVNRTNRPMRSLVAINSRIVGNSEVSAQKAGREGQLLTRTA